MAKHKGTKAILILLAILAAALLAFVALVKFREARGAGLARAIAGLEAESVPLRFKILDRGGGKVSVRFRFYDRDGSEVGKLDGSVAGEALYIDFTVLKAGDSYLAFPLKAFSDRIAPVDGISLAESYVESGFPAIFGKRKMGEGEKQAFRTAFSMVTGGKAIPDSFGSAVHDVKELRSFREGEVYRVVARRKGGLEILED